MCASVRITHFRIIRVIIVKIYHCTMTVTVAMGIHMGFARAMTGMGSGLSSAQLRQHIVCALSFQGLLVLVVTVSCKVTRFVQDFPILLSDGSGGEKETSFLPLPALLPLFFDFVMTQFVGLDTFLQPLFTP